MLAHPIVLLPESETGYLMQAVRNRCRDVIAHKNVRERVERLLLNDKQSVSLMSENHLISHLSELIQRLEPPIGKQIVTLRFTYENTYQEIALALGVSKVTVYNHLSGAIEQLRQQLKMQRP
ncbi:MAG: RNA polymerase sigma factor [Prevotella sp.]